MARTNYLVNSYGAANASGLWTGYTNIGTKTGTPTNSIVAGHYGSTAQRIQYTGVAGDASGDKTLIFYYDNSVAAVAGEIFTASCYAKGALVGCTAEIDILSYNAAFGYLGAATSAFTPTGSFSRQTVTFAGLPAATAWVNVRIKVAAIGTTDTADITIDAMQLERGSWATNYIPTTTAAKKAPAISALMAAGIL